MKLIILAAGPSSSVSSSADVPPDCLRDFDDNSLILDKTLEISQSVNNCESILVGGYRILDIIQAYPNLRYYYNPTWDQTGSLESLMRASSEFTDDLLVAYSDVVHDPAVVEKMLSEDGDIVLSFDSLWRHRYEGREGGLSKNAEIVHKNTSGEVRIAKNSIEHDDGHEKGEELGEFTGLVLFKKEILSQMIPSFRALLEENRSCGVISIFEKLGRNLKVKSVDLSGRWAELDSEADLAHFKFGTKAETLFRLESMLKRGSVLPQEMVSVGEWRSEPEAVIERVTRSFCEIDQVVVRSSGLVEDSAVTSMAGEFESILGVSLTESGHLSNAINVVSDSFQKRGEEQFDGNQILIQPMLEDVVCAGVVFTEDLETGAPYYVVNYDESGSTDSITSGVGGGLRTLVVAKRSQVEIPDPNIKALIESIKEIEKETGFCSLDVEFAIKMEGGDGSLVPRVYILQVRAIAAQKDKLKVSADDVERELIAIREYIKKDRSVSSVLCGERVAYGVMPDWNPAEIIGINPRPLAFSLYREIITDDVWGRSREECGYRKTCPRPGIVSFAGKPYVDVRMSFSSFVPASLPNDLSNRLVEHAIGVLEANPDQHDKVEFTVMPTAFDLNFDVVLNRLRNDGFSEEECKQIEDGYRSLTNEILLGNSVSVEGELAKVASLEKKRKKVAPSEVSWCSVMDLLDDCKNLGTQPFSNLARFAFIGVIQLKGLVAKGILSQERCDGFLASINTVAKDFVNDLAVETEEKLIKLYGHLRPGTYDVTSPAYHEQFDTYVDMSNRPSGEEVIHFELSDEERKLISKALIGVGLNCSPDRLFDFIRQAIEGREKGKFEFTKSLSLAIDHLIALVLECGVDRDDLSFLEVQELLDLAVRSQPSNQLAIWQSTISRRRREHIVASAIKLPVVILNESDVEVFYVPETQPNFITQKTVTASICNFEDKSNDVNGKICIIENADPGFDWLFSHNIAGLVTAYGGANSHMAIRCAEFEIPAVIGCGESLFSDVYTANTLRLDCEAKRMEVIR